MIFELTNNLGSIDGVGQASLNDDVAEWFATSKITYVVRVESKFKERQIVFNNGVKKYLTHEFIGFIDIPDDDDAALFKLKQSGNSAFDFGMVS